MNRPSQISFRVIVLLFALALCASSVWILLPEFARSGIARLPIDSEAAAVAAYARASAARAASLAAVRGDLWTELAFTYASLLWSGAEPGVDPRAVAEEARTIIERALAQAPHESSVWLLAASLASRFNWSGWDDASALEMSYYTGPNEFELIPLRLFTAMHSNALADEDVQRLVRRDVSMILARWPKLRLALIAAYKDANPDAKRFLEEAVADTDPAFLESLRANTASRS
jgi:hypothetical protein